MSCQLCNAEANWRKEGLGHEYDCPKCGRYWLGVFLTPATLQPYALQLSLAVRRIGASGGRRVELRSEDDIKRVLEHAAQLP